MSSYRVLIIGGAGVFGSRLVDAILASTDWDVVVAGRNPRRVVTRPRVSAVALDTSHCTAADLAATGAHVVVDAAGPFQDAGYRMAATVIGAGLPYLDIADGRGFVAGFGPALDAQARAHGVVALSGASSTPALSNAALDALTDGWTGLDMVTIAISPGNRAPRGHSVVRAILSYAGQGVRVWQGGRWVMRPGWAMTHRHAMPGLGPRWLSLCETPDLDIVPVRFGVRHSMVFLAGLELTVLHLALAAASLLVRVGLLSSLVPFTGAARLAAGLLAPFGTDRGGMLVRAAGYDAEGRPVQTEWSLVAEGGDGPSIPVLPVLAGLRALQAGGLPIGARVCAGVLSLGAIEAEMRRYRITTTRSLTVLGSPVFARALGARFAHLPAAVQSLHRPGHCSVFEGQAAVGGPTTRWAGWLARLVGLPRAAPSVPVTVTIATTQHGETWTRQFGGQTFHSCLSFSGLADEVEERFGPFFFRLALRADAAGLAMQVVGWRMGRMPLPRALAIMAPATESMDATGRFCFDVVIDLPFRLGRLVRYTGSLQRRPQEFPS